MYMLRKTDGRLDFVKLVIGCDGVGGLVLMVKKVFRIELGWFGSGTLATGFEHCL